MARHHHGLAISSHQFRQLGKHAHSLQGRLEKASRRTEHALDCFIDTGITLTAASGLGFVHGRFGPTELGGVPVELVLGGAGAIAGALGFGGKHASKVTSFGNGLLAPYTYDLLKGVGLNLHDKAQAAKGAGKLPAGATPEVHGRLPTQALTPTERAVMREPIEAQR